MDNINLFGIFLKEKRQQKGFSLRNLAKHSELSHIYLYNIECGKKAPPNDMILKKLATALKLDSESSSIFFELAAQSKQNWDSNNYYLPVDISQYLTEKSSAKKVIREASKNKESNDFWNDLLNTLTK